MIGVDERPEDQADHDDHGRQHEQRRDLPVAPEDLLRTQARPVAPARRREWLECPARADRPCAPPSNLRVTGPPAEQAWRAVGQSAARAVAARPRNRVNGLLHDPAFFEDLHDLVVGVLDGVRGAHAAEMTLPTACSSTLWARIASIWRAGFAGHDRPEERIRDARPASLMIAKFGSAASSSGVQSFS